MARRCRCLDRPPRGGFTLIELLVVVAVIAALLAMLAPAFSKARRRAMTATCLANMRGLQIAHAIYYRENDGQFINAGLAHGNAAHGDEEAAWINTLRQYYGNELAARSPVDTSPHWGPYPDGAPLPGAEPELRRRTSYGINNFLVDVDGSGRNPFGGVPRGYPANQWPGGDGNAYTTIQRIARPYATVHFVIMAYEGPFAAADHPHVENWFGHPKPPFIAGQQLQTHAHGGPAGEPDAVSNYGFLDGHAETLRFRDVFTNIESNRFDPRVAQ